MRAAILAVALTTGIPNVAFAGDAAQAEQLFPEWQSDPEGFRLAMTLSQTVTEGLAISLQTGAVEEEMVDPMLKLLEQRLKAMRPDAVKG